VEKDGAFAGEVRIAHADGTSTVREVTSARCDEIAEALELIAALALGLDSAPKTADPPAAPKTADPPAAPPRTAPADATPDAVRPAEPARVRFVGAVYGGIAGNVGPRAAFAPSVAIGVRLDRPGLFAPELDLSGTWAQSGAIETSLGRATLTLVEGA